MKNVRLYMILQWIFFLPVILPLCMLFGALRGAIQMADRVMDQLWTDVMPHRKTEATID
ncbi:hypothetical protein [Fibrisoma limi]|uniref:hypothetical protein n=1 Tax=Fibrisoma limi TaxID=663275 RepID=UPI0002F7932F|nr:hypothetical protein [Fibrisoma limi]